MQRAAQRPSFMTDWDEVQAKPRQGAVQQIRESPAHVAVYAVTLTAQWETSNADRKGVQKPTTPDKQEQHRRLH